MGLPLQEKYRPRTFDEIVGNKTTVEKVKSVCKREKGPPPAMLFTGPRGCGKTTFAYIIKKELGIDDRDFKDYNTANTRGIDTIREVNTSVHFMPLASKRKLYFFDECHKLTNDAQNALLKLLENPPGHILFVLATTDPQQLIPTIRSRCTPYEVGLLTQKEVRGLIKEIIYAEGKETHFPDEAVAEIAAASDGSPREALVCLDSVIDIENKEKLMSAVYSYNINVANSLDLCKALLAGSAWKEISAILSGIEDEPEKIRYAVLGYMNAVLLKSGNSRAALVIGNFLESFMYSKKAGLTFACYLSVMK